MSALRRLLTGVIVLALLAALPALRQVHKGDVVVDIDDAPTSQMSESEVPAWFLGDAGTVVTLGLMSGGNTLMPGNRRTVRLVRQPVSMVGRADPPWTSPGGPGAAAKPTAPPGHVENGAGEMAGIGAVLATDTSNPPNLVVSRLVYGGAAAFTKPSDLFGEDRLKKGDQIVAIDGRDVRGMQPVDVRPLLLGPVGSNVALMVKRAKYDRPVEIVLRRRAESMQTQFVPLEPSNSNVMAMQAAPAPSAPPPPRPPQNVPPVREQPRPPPQPEYAKRAPMPTQTVVHAPAPPPTKVGVGLVLRERSDGCHSVKRLKPGQAADHCGQIEPGDLLTHVDSLDIARGVASQFLADLIAGPQGSVVNLTFEKPDGSRVSINLLRGNADYIADVLRHENEGGAPPPPDPYSRAVEMYPPPRKQEMTSPPPVMPLEAMLAQSVGVSIALDEDYDSLVTSPERLQNFNVTFRQDVANAIRANPNRVQLVGLQRSTGIVVDLNIFPDYDDERSPQRLAAELAAQVADPRSLLRNAPSTRRVTKADVHVGHVSPPPNAAVMPPRQSDAGEAVGPPPTGHYPAAPPQPSRLNDSPAPTAPAPGTAAEKRAKAAALANSQASPRGMGKVVPMNVTGGGPAVPLPSTVDIAPPNTQDYGGEVQFEIALKNDASQRTGVVSVSSSGRLPDLLQASSSSLACNEITRVFHANGAPLIRLAEAKAGSRLLMQAAAKGQFESWSPGLVVKRRYVLRERIGEGGLGAQWLAVDSLQDQDILLVEEGDETALSVRDAILAERGQGEESNRRRWREERFLREMQVCIKVSSPNVCRVLDHGLQQGRMFQAVERSPPTLPPPIRCVCGRAFIISHLLPTARVHGESHLISSHRIASHLL